MNSVLLDTSVWVAHFRQSNDQVVALLAQDNGLSHPMVLLELACGTPPAPRARTLAALAELPRVRAATLDEVASFVEREQLFGLGCGLVDMCLLASTLITPGARLWTLDKRLAGLAGRFGVAFQPALH